MRIRIHFCFISDASFQHKITVAYANFHKTKLLSKIAPHKRIQIYIHNKHFNKILQRQRKAESDCRNAPF